MQLNVEKTKEVIVSFLKKHPPSGILPITIGGRDLERIKCTKVLGIMISNDLSWQNHVDYVCPNASQCLYLLSMLKQVGASI